jgi:hypothetical protein
MARTLRELPSAVALVVLGLGLLCGTRARADAIDACVSAATSGQQLQREGRLRDARARFLGCVKQECPAEVKAVCDGLLSAVETSLPTVIFGARDEAGNDLIAVRVAVDGTQAAESLDGKAIPLDPGPHALRFEQAGSAPIEQNVVVREAEKNRLVAVTFPSLRPKPKVERETVHRDRLLLSYVFAGVGVSALAAFTSLAIYGQNQYDHCSAHPCPRSTVDALSLDRDLTFGALGVGVVSLGVATWLYVSGSRGASTPNISLQVLGAAHGSGVGVVGRF